MNNRDIPSEMTLTPIQSRVYEVVYTAPSLKMLERLHWLSTAERLVLRRAMKRPIEFRLGHHKSWPVHERMEELDKIAWTHGVEGIITRRRAYDYLNTGDSYTPTIMASYAQQRFFVADWATIIEQEGEGTQDDLLNY